MDGLVIPRCQVWSVQYLVDLLLMLTVMVPSMACCCIVILQVWRHSLEFHLSHSWPVAALSSYRHGSMVWSSTCPTHGLAALSFYRYGGMVWSSTCPTHGLAALSFYWHGDMVASFTCTLTVLSFYWHDWHGWEFYLCINTSSPMPGCQSLFGRIL